MAKRRIKVELLNNVAAHKFLSTLVRSLKGTQRQEQDSPPPMQILQDYVKAIRFQFLKYPFFLSFKIPFLRYSRPHHLPHRHYSPENLCKWIGTRSTDGKLISNPLCGILLNSIIYLYVVVRTYETHISWNKDFKSCYADLHSLGHVHQNILLVIGIKMSSVDI